MSGFSGSSKFTGSHTGSTLGFYSVTPVARSAAIAAPTAPGTLYAQAEAQSAVTAINEIRTALKNVGIIA